MNFSEKMEEMKKTITLTDIDDIRRNIENFKELSEKMLRSRQGNLNKINQLLNSVATNICSVKRSYDFQQETVRLWMNNKISIIDIARNTPGFWEGKLDLRYTEDMDRNIINLARDMMNTISIEQPYTIIAIMGDVLNQQEKQEFEKYINQRIMECAKFWNKERERMYNEALCSVCKFLDLIGKMKKNLDVHNSRVIELGIPEMQINYEQGKGKELLNKLCDLHDLDKIRKLDLYTKKVLLAFYSNRLTKELESLITTIYIICKVGDIEAAHNLDDESLRKLVLEQKYLTILWKNELKRYEGHALVDRYELYLKGSRVCSSKKVDDSIYYRGIDVIEFEEYFGKDSYEEDRKILAPYITLLKNIYTAKTYSMETLIYPIVKDAKEVKVNNWGYIPEVNKKGQNSIESKKENILIGIDFPRYNMPIRLHINRESLESLVRKTIGVSKIPVYKGSEDFEKVKLNGRRRYMGTQILMPIQKGQRKALEKAVEKQKNNPNYDCIAHLNWLAYPNRVPEHLQNQPSKEVDLATGEIYLSGVDIGDSDGR